MKQKSKIDLIVELIRPPEREAECRKHIARSLALVRDVSIDTAPGRTRAHLRKAVTALKNAKKELAALPQHLRSDLSATEIDRLISVADRHAKQIVVARSGGSNKAEAARKIAAAMHAFDLLNDWGRRVPALTHDGEYYEIAAALYRLATGRARNVDLEGPCKAFFKMLEKDGFPNARDRKRMIESGRNSGDAFERLLARWA